MGVDWRKDAALSEARRMARSGMFDNVDAIRRVLAAEEKDGFDLTAIDSPLVRCDLNQLCALSKAQNHA